MTSFDKPAVVPPIRPIPEHSADPTLSATYHDVKRTFGVPWVGVVVQALAHYRPFFDHAYAQLRPALGTHYFERVATDLRLLSWREMITRFSITDHATTLRDKFGYSERELDEIRQLLDVFDYGNPKYFLLATAVKEALISEKPLGGVQPSDPADLLPRPPVTAVSPIPAMLEEHHVNTSMGELYSEMKATLDLPFVNSDYKAMARWPTYLELAWHELKPTLDTEHYVDVRRTLNDRCVTAVRELPYPYHLGREQLRHLGMSASERDELVDVVRLFQALLSGLIVNVTHFKIGMSGGSESARFD